MPYGHGRRHERDHAEITGRANILDAVVTIRAIIPGPGSTSTETFAGTAPGVSLFLVVM
jgi:hypothetical protein